CLKCGDKGRRVADCPKAGLGEAERLLAAQLQKWRDGVTVLGYQPNRHPTERGTLVEGLVGVENVLLDSGADVNVVSRGVMDALALKNAAVVFKPRKVYPYGADAKPLEVERCAKFGTVTLDTTCGPLTLRGLQAWIDDTSTAIDLIVSRPVMESLDTPSTTYSAMLGLFEQPLDVGRRAAGRAQKGSRHTADDDRQSSNQRVHRPDAMADAQPGQRHGVPRRRDGLFYAGLNQGEFFSFMTPFGVYTPTRVLMGQTDALAYCQSVVHQMFGDLLFRGLLAWLGDLLGSANTVAELFQLLDQVLTTCGKLGLMLNPKKCDFFLKEAEWCGKVISAAGVTHCPSRIQGLVGLSSPTTAADLQQFVCATNWMLASIPDHNKFIDPLRRLLDVAVKSTGSSKKTTLARVALAAIGWSD
ncbi:hypothetical protein As57867_007294, partial [Aphanomyces stellatus]